MKTTVFAALLFATALAVSPAAAQPAPFNDAGVTMGHWHIISKDVEANKKLFLGMGAKMFMVGGNPLMMFPGVNNRPDQAFVVTPDGVRIEILEDKTQSVPVRNEHVHLFVTEAEIPKAQAWYAKTFGGKAGTRNNAAVVDIPGVQIRFAKADTAQVPTRGRILDHIGFDVKDHAAFVKKIEAEGIKLDEPARKTPTGSSITYITDPWGTRIEIIERGPLGSPVL